MGGRKKSSGETKESGETMARLTFNVAVPLEHRRTLRVLAATNDLTPSEMVAKLIEDAGGE